MALRNDGYASRRGWAVPGTERSSHRSITLVRQEVSVVHPVVVGGGGGARHEAANQEGNVSKIVCSSLA